MLWPLSAAPGSSRALASAGNVRSDFNGDGRDDLAVGVPDEDVGAISGGGAVNVIYGSPGGLSATGNQLWTQDSPGIGDAAEPGDAFGRSLAAGDFNGDGRDDLAVGVPFEDIVAIANVGAVNVMYGSPGGLSATGSQLWSQDTSGILDPSEPGDDFGRFVTAGDFNGDGRDDLAVGERFEYVGTIGQAGAVNVIYGTTRGLSATGNQFWHQDSPGILDAAEGGDNYGRSLAAGDFNGDGRDDLAVAVPFEDIGTIADGGAVNVIYGTTGGLSATGNQFWTQNSPGILDAVEGGDSFSRTLAAGDLNGDGRDDLAVGVPTENVGTIGNAGAVNVIYGTAGGLSATGNQFWHQDSPGILDAAEPNDMLVWRSLAARGDFNGDGRDELVMGGPLEAVGTNSNAGAANVIYGTARGLSATGNQFWHQNSPGILDAVETDDMFSYALS